MTVIIFYFIYSNFTSWKESNFDLLLVNTSNPVSVLQSFQHLLFKEPHNISPNNNFMCTNGSKLGAYDFASFIHLFPKR